MQFRVNSKLTFRTPLPSLDSKRIERVTRALALEAVRLMRERTAAGKDVQGSPFKPFSAEYARRRRLSGRETTPRMQLSGQLLNGLGILEITGGHGVVGWGAKSDTVTRFRRIRTKSGKRSSRILAASRRELADLARASGLGAKDARRFVKKNAEEKDIARWELTKTEDSISAVLKASYLEKQGRKFFGVASPDDLRRMEAVARREVAALMKGRR